MLTERDLKIIKYCVSENKFVTTEEIAQHLNVSSRTIKTNISQIEKKSELIGVQVEMTRGVGIMMNISNVELFNKKINQPKDTEDYNIQTNRLIYIIQKFINENSCIGEDDLLNELYVSRTLLLEDIEIVRELFLEEGVVLKRVRSKGWIAEGNEEQFRKLLAKYIELDIEFLESYKMYLANSKLSFDEITTLKNLVIELLHKHGKQAYGVNITNMIIHILILVNRIRSGNSLNKFVVNTEIPILEDDMNIVKEIVEIVEDLYHLEISVGEETYLYSCMIGKYSDFNETKDPIVIKFLSDVFEEIKVIFGIDVKDHSFFDAIYAHTQSLITRVRLNVKLEQMIEIRISDFVLPNECSLLYKKKFEDYFNHTIDDVELYYIMIHFGAYLEKQRRVQTKRYILLVSDERLSVSMFIKNKLNSELDSNIEIESIIQTHEILEVDLSNYDYIISTENISSVCDNFLLIDKSATMLTIRQVQEYINDNRTLYSFFKKDLFFKNYETENMESLIVEISNVFKNNNYILDESEFYREVLTREEYQSTRLNHGLAIPHPMKPVSSNSFISTIIPKTPIIWSNGKEAKLIFLISLAQVKDRSEVNVIFDVLSKIASDSQLINELIKKEDYESFMKTVIYSKKKEI